MGRCLPIWNNGTVFASGKQGTTRINDAALNLRGEVFLTGLIVFLNAFGLQNFVIDGKFVQPSLPGAIELVVVSEEKVT